MFELCKFQFSINIYNIYFPNTDSCSLTLFFSHLKRFTIVCGLHDLRYLWKQLLLFAKWDKRAQTETGRKEERS